MIPPLARWLIERDRRRRARRAALRPYGKSQMEYILELNRQMRAVLSEPDLDDLDLDYQPGRVILMPHSKRKSLPWAPWSTR